MCEQGLKTPHMLLPTNLDPALTGDVTKKLVIATKTFWDCPQRQTLLSTKATGGNLTHYNDIIIYSNNLYIPAQTAPTLTLYCQQEEPFTLYHHQTTPTGGAPIVSITTKPRPQ